MLKRAVLVFAIFVTTSGLVARASRSEPIPIRASFATFPTTLGDWRGGPSQPLDQQVLGILGVNDYLVRGYFGERKAAGLYVGYWQSQRQGDSIHSPLNCLPGAGWQPLSKRDMDIEVADPTIGGSGLRTIEINRYVIQKGLEQQLVLYWYQSHGRVVASEYAGKVYLVADAIRLNRTDAAIVRVIVPIAVGAENAESHAEQDGVAFVKTLFPVLTRYLPS